MTVQAPLLSCLYWENYCYTHNPYVPYMPDINHVDSCPHTAVDNTLVIRMVCARSDGVLSGSWVHVPRPPRFHTRSWFFNSFRSRFPLY